MNETARKILQERRDATAREVERLEEQAIYLREEAALVDQSVAEGRVRIADIDAALLA